MSADLDCLEDLNPMGLEVDTKRSLFQDNYHRLIEGKGSNIDDEDRGVGVYAWLNAPILPSYRHLIERELRRDDRNTSVIADVVASSGETFTISVEYTYDTETVGIEINETGLVTT